MTAPVALLAIMAHPDDAELWAGGALAATASAGLDAHVLVATTDPVRAREARAGADILGTDLHLHEALDPTIVKAAITELRPEVIVTHRHDDPHPDHRAAAAHVLAALPDAVIATGYPHRLYTCDTYNSLTLTGRVPGHAVLDIGEHFTTKLAALAAHTSQPVAHFTAMAQRLSAYWGATRGCQWGEAFDPTPVLGRLPVAAAL